MQPYVEHLLCTLDELAERSKIMFAEAVRLETEKESISRRLGRVIDGVDHVSSGVYVYFCRTMVGRDPTICCSR